MSDQVKILVIDDEQVMRDGCERILSRNGYSVIPANNGDAGLVELDKASKEIDIVLLDLLMPGIGGMDVLERIRALDKTLTVIMLTGYATVDAAVEAMKKGAFDFIAKPFTPEQLRSVVKRALERRKPHAEGEREMTSTRVKNKNYPLIPEDERQCIWMGTGLVSYKLCDRNYRCDICPFDRAIKNEESVNGDLPESEEEWGEGSPLSDPSARINGAVFYHPDHCWVKVEKPERARIGIDNLLSQLIGDVNAVILPQEGSFAFRGECCAHIIQEYYILPVVSPLSGLIQSVNQRLREEPGLIAGDPAGEGWLMTVKPGNLERDLRGLLFGRKALSWYQREEKEIIARTDSMLKRNPQAVGPTMQDGGVRIGGLQDLLNIISSRQKAQILDLSVARHGNFRRLMSETAG